MPSEAEPRRNAFFLPSEDTLKSVAHVSHVSRVYHSTHTERLMVRLDRSGAVFPFANQALRMRDIRTSGRSGNNVFRSCALSTKLLVPLSSFLVLLVAATLGSWGVGDLGSRASREAKCGRSVADTADVKPATVNRARLYAIRGAATSRRCGLL